MSAPASSAPSRTGALALALVAGYTARATAGTPAAAPTAKLAQPAPSRELGVLVFSKDRAWQLSQLLVSLAQAQSTFPEENRAALRVAVIYTYSGQAHAESYTRLHSQHPAVEFLDESQPPSHPPELAIGCLQQVDCAEEDARFTNHLACILHRWQHEQQISTLLFGVDDMLFYRDDLPFLELISLLESDASSEVLAVHLALHSGVTFCHPANKDAQKPPLQPIRDPFTSKPGSLEILKFMRYLGTRDWSYPFSLAGSMYRVEDVVRIVAACITSHGAASIAHPNKLEVLGNRIVEHGAGQPKDAAPPKEEEGAKSAAAAATVSPLSSHRLMSCCLSQPVMSVITVNRVQEIYQNRIYDAQPQQQPVPVTTQKDDADTSTDAAAAVPFSSSSSSSPADLSADALLHLSLARPHLSFDLARYRAAASAFHSVHVGEFFIKEG